MFLNSNNQTIQKVKSKEKQIILKPINYPGTFGVYDSGYLILLLYKQKDDMIAE